MAISKPGGSKPAAAKPVTQAPRSKYAGTTSTKASRDANYFSAGRYLTLIERVEESENQGGALINAVNHVILMADGSTRDDTGIDSKSGPLKRPGESVSDIFSKANKAYAANLMAFAITLSGMTQEEIREAELAEDPETKEPGYEGKFIEEIVGESQPFAGKIVEMNCKVHPSKAAKASGKPLMDIPMGKDGLFLKASYLRVVPFAEVQAMVESGEIDAKIAARFLPDLAEKVAIEAAEGQEGEPTA
jgi:hypothetical protein